MLAFINVHQNRFINECARKQKAKIPEFGNFGKTELFCEI